MREQSRSYSEQVLHEARRLVGHMFQQLQPAFAPFQPDAAGERKLRRTVRALNETICQTALILAPYLVDQPTRRKVCRRDGYLGVTIFPSNKRLSLTLDKDPFVFAYAQRASSKSGGKE